MKLPQAAVSYRPATDPARRCDACIMWQHQACTRVEGPIDPAGTCDIFYPAETAPGTSLVELAAEAYLSGWAVSEGPLTGRIEAGQIAAARVVLEHQEDSGVLEAALLLGHLEGIWATIYQRRERLQARQERAILAAWRAALAGLDPGELARRFRTALGETTDPDRQWWQDTATAAAAAWLAGVYRADGYDALIAALADAIRSGMAEGEAGALALAASKLGRTGFAIDRAFRAAYKRLADDQSITRQAAQAATRLIDAAAAAVGRRLATVQGDGGSEQDMTGAIDDETTGNGAKGAQAPRAGIDALIWAALGAGAMALFNLAGVGLVTWQDVGDDRECGQCMDNAAGSPYDLSSIPAFPAHFRCRCSLDAADSSPLSAYLAAYLS